MKLAVQVQQDHIKKLTSSDPIKALAELVWNALDADATQVEIEFEVGHLGIEEVIIRDNGLGMTLDEARAGFSSLGGSWKGHASRTKTKKRMLHGREGMAVLRDAGATGFATIKDELSRLEKEKAEAQTAFETLRARIEVLEADRLPDGMIVDAYRRLGAALETTDRLALARVLPSIIRQIVWHPATDGSRGGRYQMTLWPTPLIPETLGSAEAENEAVGSHCSKVWLPHLDSNQEPTD